MFLTPGAWNHTILSLEINVEYYSSSPFMTRNICPQQELMNPILKEQFGPEKLIQKRTCTCVTAVLEIKTGHYFKFFLNSIIPSMYSYASAGLTIFFFSICAWERDLECIRMHTHNQENLLIYLSSKLQILPSLISWTPTNFISKGSKIMRSDGFWW